MAASENAVSGCVFNRPAFTIRAPLPLGQRARTARRRQSAGLAADRLVMEPSRRDLLACFAVSLASSGHRTS
jgi:hypothetical protein